MDHLSNLNQPESIISAASSQKEAINLCEFLARRDFCFLSGGKTQKLLTNIAGNLLESWPEFQESWNRLERDNYMRDGGTYRFRRHATFSAMPSGRHAYLEAARPHFQSLDYNPLNGDIARHFAPIEHAIASGSVLTSALTFCCELFGRLAPYYTWHIEVHQFRIDAAQFGANPTPEGVHRDGVNFVFMMMVNRINVVNGETNIFNRAKERLSSYTLSSPFDTAIVNDEHVMHGVTPIVQLDTTRSAYRDVLVITFAKK